MSLSMEVGKLIQLEERNLKHSYFNFQGETWKARNVEQEKEKKRKKKKEQEGDIRHFNISLWFGEAE